MVCPILLTSALTHVFRYSLGNVLLGYLVYNWLAGMYIFCNFAVSHTHLDVLEADEDVSWVRQTSSLFLNQHYVCVCVCGGGGGGTISLTISGILR